MVESNEWSLSPNKTIFHDKIYAFRVRDCPGWCYLNTANSCSKFLLYFFHTSWSIFMSSYDFLYHKICYIKAILKSDYEIPTPTVWIWELLSSLSVTIYRNALRLNFCKWPSSSILYWFFLLVSFYCESSLISKLRGHFTDFPYTLV